MTDPATGTVLAAVACAEPADVAQAIAAADIARRGWAGRPATEKSRPARSAERRPRRSEPVARPESKAPSEPRHPVRQHSVPIAADANVTPFPQRERPQPRPAARERDEAPSARGFGDHLPAFLARAPRLAGQG